MTNKDLKDNRFHHAKQEAEFAEKADISTAQTRDPTLVMYGSARIPAPEHADALIEAATDDESLKIAQRLKEKAKYYDEARHLARLASACGISSDGKRDFVVCSGGGPSIMEAANRGAADVGKESIGLNIVLPHEQAPNEYVTPSLSFQFHYFALRKMHFLLRARAVAVFPGGFGTLDEFLELVTLVQTGKMEKLPILLFGKDFWNRVINFDALADEGTISRKDLEPILPPPLCLPQLLPELRHQRLLRR